jgi:hypothetical protein
MFTYNSFHRISKMYKKIRERSTESTWPNILPTSEELALRLSGSGQLTSTINQVAVLNGGKRMEDGTAAGLNVVNSAEDGLAAGLNVVNNAEDGIATVSNVVNQAKDGLAAGLNVVSRAEDGLPPILNVANRAVNSLCSNSTTHSIVKLNNTPVPTKIKYVSSIMQVNNILLLNRTKTSN